MVTFFFFNPVLNVSVILWLMRGIFSNPYSRYAVLEKALTVRSWQYSQMTKSLVTKSIFGKSSTISETVQAAEWCLDNWIVFLRHCVSINI